VTADPYGRPAEVEERDLARVAAFRSELRGFLQRTEDVTDEAGLTPQRYDLLLMISWTGADEGVRLTDLCGLLHMQQPAVTELVKRAEQAKLVKRRASPHDRRASLLRLTAEGERRLMRAVDALRDDRDRLAVALVELKRRLESADR
jgi:DNA-binding MarR family transcriptional regulator